MSMGGNISIMGLYNNDPTIFDLMAFPEDFTNDQKELVRDNILVECAELEILYPNSTVMKNIISIWSQKEVPYWDRFYKAQLLQYDPIENYHRNETETIEDDRTEQHSGTDTATAGGTDSTTGNSSSTDTNSGTDTTTNNVTGYDSNDLVLHDQQTMQHGHTIGNTANGTNSTTYGRTDSMQHGERIEHNNDVIRTVEAYGNIGVTTSQQMLQSELDIAKIANVMNVIIESFKDRFCIMVY